MQTQVIEIDPNHMDPIQLNRAAAILRQGGLVAFPTETVYALAADSFNPSAVERVFLAKGHPATDPLIVHIAHRDQVEQVAREVPPLAMTLADAFWPGPLTLVLPRQPAVPDAVTAGLDTVAVRWPAHPVICALIEAAGVPLVGPSANRFGHTSPTTAQHVLADLEGRIDAVIDSGPTRIGVESTVVDVSGVEPRLLRPGGVSLEVLRAHIPDLSYQPAYMAESTAAPAPGMLLKHYAPRARMIVFEGETAAILRAMNQAIDEAHRGNQRVGILITGAHLASVSRTNVVFRSLPGQPDQQAAALFRVLRELDDSGVDLILAESVPPVGLGLAIRDRLIRAASGQVRRV